MIPSEAELVDLEACAYDPARTPFIATFDNAVRVFLDTSNPDFNTFEIQGTRDRIGWALDFIAAPHTPGHEDADLGFLHLGFYLAAKSVTLKMSTVLASKPTGIVCHSLGGAIGLLNAVWLAAGGVPPLFVRAYAPPRVGGAKFVAAVAKLRNVIAYRNGDDPVPQVPFTLPDFPYEQIPLTHVGPVASPTNAFSFLPPEIFRRVGFHHISAYQHAIKGDAA